MRRSLALTIALIAAGAAPALAQDHARHVPAEVPRGGQCEEEAQRHGAMGHPVAQDACDPLEAPEAREPNHAHHHAVADGQQGGHDTMSHAAMDHPRTANGGDHHAAMDHGAAADPMSESTRPLEAGSGPSRAADAIWGAAAMRASREALRREHGAMTSVGLTVDRLEYRTGRGGEGFLWDAAGWYGGDIDRVWVESEGEGAFGDGVEEADVALLYGRAISPWFDLQAGLRQQFGAIDRTYLDVGIQGVAPHFVEVEADLYLSTEGDITAAAELEIDQRITQRLILQPRAELAVAAQDVPELGIGAGVDKAELGLRLRYELLREFAPYIGVEHEWKIGRSADVTRAAGQAPSSTSVVAGMKFWF